MPKDSRPCLTVSQYQLDALVMQDTQHLCLTQPPPQGNSMHTHNICFYKDESMSHKHPQAHTPLKCVLIRKIFYHIFFPVILKNISPQCSNYRIRSNYRTYPYKRTVKKFRSLQITASIIFLYFFLKAYVVGTHLNCIDLSMQFK